MTSLNFTSILLVLAVVALVSVRQTRWTAISADQIWRGPVILGVIGVGLITFGGQGNTFNTTDIAFFVVELVASAAIGALIGAVAHFRPITEQGLHKWQSRKKNQQGGAAPEFEARNGTLGLIIWVLLIAARIGFSFWEASIGGHLAQASGTILLFLAANRLLRSVVITQRTSRVLALARA
ncbi:hypothetical protein G7068_10190 [Leucobacter viscericola]|uniref:DUF1453 domain-containing protein n=1 Tax=Leucobacter viscericola TaxID=2714935 RepID=A0A6G7XGK2_9MICO|nr:hypothetical protein [Leucobacter viscericola]QIK63527.1 hypothetical protein G7068_10190 [Leucobacter viscericola]